MRDRILSDAVLLLGPTGSGKSPFGEWLEGAGLWGRRCHHFDFGANLRAVAGGHLPGFTPAEIRLARDVVHGGRLLEDDEFPLALRILTGFASGRRPRERDLLVMNGLPRHEGQAAALAPFLSFIAVLELKCGAATVMRRLRENSGGDRAFRADDGLELVGRKLELYRKRTRPLLAYYRRRRVPVVGIRIGVTTRPGDIAAQLPPELPAATVTRGT